MNGTNNVNALTREDGSPSEARGEVRGSNAMAVEFTPGPWCVEDDEFHDFTVRAVGAPLAIAAVVNGSINRLTGDGARHEANARLIAAAPELYEALEELTALMESVYAGEYKPDSFTTQPARAALEKARGERS